MIDELIIVGFAILALVIVWPFSWLLERHLNRTYQDGWRRVQEETKAKGVAVGEWKELLKRSGS